MCVQDVANKVTLTTYPNEQPIHEGVQGSANQKNVKRSEKQPLRLQIPFGSLKGRVARGSNKNDPQVSPSQDCNVFLGYYFQQYHFSAKPNDTYRDCDGP